MIWPFLLSGFTLGIAGSLHCVGMCGPLSLALPIQHLSRQKRFLSLLSYQLGRIITYGIMGLLLGLAGRQLYIAGYQQWFSFCAGIIILLLSSLYFLQRHLIRTSFFNKSTLIKKFIGNVLQKANGPTGFLFFGMANGLLPCGMVYVALLSTLSFTEVSHSLAFMAMFGAGTLPAMMMAAYVIQKLKWKNRIAVRRAIPYVIAMMGLLLILRGMNLGIPFLSPNLSPLPEPISCHS